MNYTERRAYADTTKAGDVWKELRSGKTVTVVGRFGLCGIELLRASGAKGSIMARVLASKYEPVTADNASGEQT